MPLKSRTTLKSYFETNDNPTESQYADLIDSTPNFVDDSPTYGFNWRGAYVSGTTYVKYDAVFYSVTGSSYVCILAHDVERLPTNTTYWSKIVEGGSGSGDMTAAVYDPTSVVGNAFSMANMAETADAKILTAAERTAISNNSAKLTCDATNVAVAGAVMNTGNEAIAGIKTFSSSPIVPAPTTDLQVATKKYVDDNAGSGTPEGTAVKSTGETGGTKFLREDGDGTCSWQAVAAGTGDVVGPASHAASYIPQWNGTPNSKTLVEGVALPTGGLVGVTATQTLTNKTLTSPKINEDVALTATASELNRIDGINSLTGVLRADSGALSVDTNVTDIVSSASTTVAGKVQLATSNAVTSGTGEVVAVTPYALARSETFGAKTVQIMVFDSATDWSTGDGKAYFVIPRCMNTMDLVRVHARCITAGTTGTSDIQIRNVTDSVDILSTKLTIDSGETGSDTAATAAVINTSNDNMATNDLIAIDIDATATTKPKGLIVTLEFMGIWTAPE